MFSDFDNIFKMKLFAVLERFFGRLVRAIFVCNIVTYQDNIFILMFS